jgi:hypothetical protein
MTCGEDNPEHAPDVKSGITQVVVASVVADAPV